MLSEDEFLELIARRAVNIGGSGRNGQSRDLEENEEQVEVIREAN
jgi:hypothetical protein